MSATVVKEECADTGGVQTPTLPTPVSGSVQVTNVNSAGYNKISNNNNNDPNGTYNLSVLLTDRVQKRSRTSPVVTSSSNGQQPQVLPASPSAPIPISNMKHPGPPHQPKNGIVNNHHPGIPHPSMPPNGAISNGIDYSNNNNPGNHVNNNNSKDKNSAAVVTSSAAMPAITTAPQGEGKRNHANNKSQTNVSI